MMLSKNEDLRALIVSRLKEVFKYQRHLIKDAEERGMHLTASRLNKYLKGHEGGINEEQILWIATRLGIYINLGLGKPILKDGKLQYEVTEFNEAEALAKLKKIFKNG